MMLARIWAIGKILLLVVLYCVWVMVALALSMQVFAGGNLDGKISIAFLISYIVLILAPLWLFGKWMSRGPGWVKKVQADGKQATATIVKVGDTGITINRTRREILVQLRVEPSDGEPFEVIQQKEISLFGGGGYSEGTRLQVKYDPNNKKHVVIMDSADAVSSYSERYATVSAATGYNNSSRHGTSSTSGVVLTDKLAELSDLHKSGELSDSEFEAAKKKLFDQ